MSVFTSSTPVTGTARVSSAAPAVSRETRPPSDDGRTGAPADRPGDGSGRGRMRGRRGGDPGAARWRAP